MPIRVLTYTVPVLRSVVLDPAAGTATAEYALLFADGEREEGSLVLALPQPLLQCYLPLNRLWGEAIRQIRQHEGLEVEQ